MHYAVYKNNYKIAQLFEKYGADIYQTNSLGLSVMHIAAQGGSPLLLVIIISFSIIIFPKDSI